LFYCRDWQDVNYAALRPISVLALIGTKVCGKSMIAPPQLFSGSGSDPRVLGLQAVSRAQQGIEKNPLLASIGARSNPVPARPLLTTG
jgi:hypothetical protein